MKPWWNDLDRILRGDATSLGAIKEDRLGVPLGRLLLCVLLMTIVYGICMGFYAGFRDDGPVFMQWLAVTAKVPSLFFLTVAVTFPSLYVFNALVGSRLTVAAVFELVIASLAVNVAVLASFGPIVAFFSVSTTSYPFILLLNVLVFVVSGVFGFAFMLQTLYRMSAVQRAAITLPQQADSAESTEATEDAGPHETAKQPPPTIMARVVQGTGALWGVQGHLLDRRVKTVFMCWMLVSGLICAQMTWVLRPFLGRAGEPFQWFCVRESNFFTPVWEAVQALLK